MYNFASPYRNYVNANDYLNVPLRRKRSWMCRLFFCGPGSLVSSCDDGIIFDYMPHSFLNRGNIDFFDGYRTLTIYGTKAPARWIRGDIEQIIEKNSGDILAESVMMPSNCTRTGNLKDCNCFEVKTQNTSYYIHAKYKVFCPIPFIKFELIDESSYIITLEDENYNIIMSARPWTQFDGITLHQKCEEVDVLLPMFFSYSARVHLLKP